jgi:3'-phosphoadenosine 5'-phosphosulfate sulfotransferase (PAPS reductase)/FAD synthetase/ferredoxin
MFKLRWDKETNGVRLCETAPEEDLLAVPPRPVFFEELDLLGLDKPPHNWRYPRANPDGSPLTAPLLWACERRYFYRGEHVLTAQGGNLHDAPTLLTHGTAAAAAGTAPRDLECGDSSPLSPSATCRRHPAGTGKSDRARQVAPDQSGEFRAKRQDRSRSEPEHSPHSKPAPAGTASASAAPAPFTLVPVDLAALVALNAELLFLLEYEALEFIHNTWRKYAGVRKARDAAPVNAALDFEQMRREYEKREKRPYAIIKENCESFDIMPADTAAQLGKQTLLSTKTEMFVASFSGGKDSQVLIDLVTRAVPPDAFRVVYSDTGYELPTSLKIYEDTKRLYQQKFPALEFLLAKNHEQVLHYWDKIGIPSNHFRWCCGVMKTAPLYRTLKDISGLGRQPHILTFDGVRAEESEGRSHYGRIGKGVKHNNVINARPILYWNNFEIFLYLFARNLPINPAYRSGLTRVGCVICPFASSWSDHFCGRICNKELTPFYKRINEFVRKAGVRDADAYIKEGNWKSRGSGREMEIDYSLNVVSALPDFKAIAKNPQENFLEWLKVLGDYTMRSDTAGEIFISLKYKRQIFDLKITGKFGAGVRSLKNISFTLTAGNVIVVPSFAAHLRKVLNKSVYCCNCEFCEVECPTGALAVVPVVSVNSSTCIHCFSCLDFDDKGCVTAKSLNTTTGTVMKVKTIDRYNTFGLRGHWLAKYLSDTEKFFANGENGLNVRKQIPALKHWLQEAGIIELPAATVTGTGTALARHYGSSQTTVWEIIWVNLTENAEIAKWYAENIDFGLPFTAEEMGARLREHYTGRFSERTLQNALTALRNTFKESPLGSTIPVCVSVDKNTFVRSPVPVLSTATVAYSLYRYAEKNKRHNLTVGEFYRDGQKDGVFRQFGLPREALERALRTLKEEKNRVLDADLNMGLDNIKLREDLTSTKVLELLLQ